jgi:hypothetical protein
MPLRRQRHAAAVAARGFAHESQAWKTVEWYTPAHIFDALGLRFDLDPCQPANGVPWIPADRYYALPLNGLREPWEGRVWLNPPYGKYVARWLGKFLEHGNGVALVFARTGTTWAQTAIASADAVCFIAGRVAFVAPNGFLGDSSADSMLLACGPDNTAALRRSGLGVVLSGVERAKNARRQRMRFRKKPVVIEAVQYDGSNHEAIGYFAGQAVSLESGGLFVRTLENRRLEADKGDWIIKGVKGEFYPCKPDIFAATYERVDEPQ